MHEGWEEHLNITLQIEKYIDRVDKSNRVRARDARFRSKEDFFSGMEVVFLGTGAGRIQSWRSPTAIVLKMENSSFLFDCGEGTQQQFHRNPRCNQEISNIFISHLHGDHIFGLHGMISEIESRRFQKASNSGRNRPMLNIFGPLGLGEYMGVLTRMTTWKYFPKVNVYEIEDPSMPAENKRMMKRSSKSRETCKIIRPDKKGIIHVCETEDAIVKAVHLPHVSSMSSLAYVVQEKKSDPNLDIKRLIEDGIHPGPIYTELKKGQTVTLPNGKKIHGPDYWKAQKPGRKVAVVLDTFNSEKVYKLAKGADLLIHDSSFGKSMGRKAYESGHSTAAQAGHCAKMCGAGTLALTHFSGRYNAKDPLGELLSEAKQEFQSDEVFAAQDHMSIPIVRPSQRDSGLVDIPLDLDARPDQQEAMIAASKNS